MDKTPNTSSSERRSNKRPHSPRDENPTPIDPIVPATEAESLLESDAKRDKLLRLLGGKKRKNETAASKWLERVRTRDDEVKVTTELESQFNESLTHKLSGAARRHLGIGFKEGPPATTEPTNLPNTTPTDPKRGDKGTHDFDNAKPDHLQNSIQQSLLESLSNRANVSSLLSRAPRLGQNVAGPGYGPPRPYHGYRMGDPNMIIPQNYGYPGIHPMAHGMAPPPPPPPIYGYGTSYAGQNVASNTGHGYHGTHPPPPPPPPSDSNDSKPPEPGPKSRSAFYAQFKKAS